MGSAAGEIIVGREQIREFLLTRLLELNSATGDMSPEERANVSASGNHLIASFMSYGYDEDKDGSCCTKSELDETISDAFSFGFDRRSMVLGKGPVERMWCSTYLWDVVGVSAFDTYAVSLPSTVAFDFARALGKHEASKYYA